VADAFLKPIAGALDGRQSTPVSNAEVAFHFSSVGSGGLGVFALDGRTARRRAPGEDGEESAKSSPEQCCFAKRSGRCPGGRRTASLDAARELQPISVQSPKDVSRS
jgi:hypothetical protein